MAEENVTPTQSIAPSRSQRAATYWAATGTLLGLVLFFLPVFTSGATFFARDTLRMHAPIRGYAAARLLSGELPLWWSYEALGTPFFAQAVTSVLHPLALLVAPLSPPHAIRWLTLLCFFTGALGVLALARRLALSPGASSFAALGYSLSGYLVSMSDNWFYLAGACSVPWFLWAADRIAQSAWPQVPWAALVLGSVLLLGDFQAAYVMAAVGVAWAMARTPAGEGRVRRGLWVVVAIALGAAVGAIQLAASWELLGHTARGEGLKLEETTRWSLHPFRLAELFFGPVLPMQGGRYEYSRLLMGDPLRGVWANCVYLGSIITALAGAALVAGRRLEGRWSAGWVWFLGGLAGVALWMAMGRYGGLYSVALELAPLWSAFRFPEKLLPFLVLPVCLLAAAALDSLERLPVLPWLGGVGLAAALLAGALELFPLAAAQFLVAVGEVSGSSTPALRLAAAKDLVSTAADSSLYAALGCGLAAALVWVLGGRKPGLARFAVAAAALGQLALTTQHSYDLTTPELYELVPPLAHSLRGKAEGGRFRFITLTGAQSARPALAVEGLSPTEQLSVWEKNGLSPDFNVPYGLDHIHPYLPGALENLAELRRTSGNWARVASLFSTRYLILSQGDWEKSPAPPPAQVIDALPQMGLVLVDTQDAVPRAYLGCAERYPTRQAALQRMVSDDFPRGTSAVVVDSDAEGRPLPACAERPGPHGTVTLLDYQQERIRLHTEAPHPALLVLNDAFYPGWEARVDGAEVPITQVNLAVRGVAVPPGSHEVVFEYRPRWLGPASLTSAVAALGLVGLAVWARRRRRPKRTSVDDGG